MKKVLVTGANGFLGRHVLLPLRGRGFEVHAVGRNAPGPELAGQAIWHTADLLQPEAGRQLLQELRPEGLMHLAWDTSPGAYWTTPANLDWAAASLFLFSEFARNGGQRLVVAGTCAEYDWTVGGPLTEGQTPLRPASLYGCSKNAVRQVLEAWAPGAGISWAWGRLFCVFGPHEKPQRLVPKMIAKLLEGKPIPFDAATAVQDFMDVRDAADAFAALQASPVAGAINIAAGQPVAIRTVLTELETALGTPGLLKFGELKGGPNQPADLIASTRRLNEELGWNPGRTRAERLEETSQWWKRGMKSEK